MEGLIETIFQHINIDTLSQKELDDAILYLDFLIAKETEINKVITYCRTKSNIMQRLVELDRNKYINFS